MKIKFENGNKIYISNDGKTHQKAEDCIEHNLEILYGLGRNKCTHEWKYYTKTNTQFGLGKVQIGVQCSKCGKLGKEVEGLLNLDKLIDHVSELSDIDKKQENLEEIYEFLIFMNDNYHSFFSQTTKNNKLPDLTKFKKFSKWIKKLLNTRTS
jgi:hypothetical protein